LASDILARSLASGFVVLAGLASLASGVVVLAGLSSLPSGFGLAFGLSRNLASEFDGLFNDFAKSQRRNMLLFRTQQEHKRAMSL
jgi:hypothetical protein